MSGAALRAFFLALLALLLTPAVAWGHAEQVEASPAPYTVLPSAPAEVRVRFSEPLAPGSSTLQVYDAEGRRVDRGDARVDGADPTTLAVSVEPLPDGVYLVAWTTVSTADGHTRTGSYRFRVGPGRPPAPLTATDASPSLDPLAVAARWLGLVGQSLALGALAFRRWCADPRWGSNNLPLRLDLGGLALVVLDVAVTLPSAAALLSEGDGVAMDALRLAMPVASTLTRLVAALCLGAALWRIARRGVATSTWNGGLLLGALVALGRSIGTHAVGSPLPAVAVGLDAAHQIAVGVWLGGLVTLLASLRHLRHGGTLSTALERFARMALIAMAVLLLSGVASAALVLPEVAALWSTPYGVVLLAKAALALAIVSLAAFTRLALLPRVRLHAHGLTGFRLAATAEAAVAGVALALAALLSLLPVQPVVATPPLDVRYAVEGVELSLALASLEPGPNQVTVHLTGGVDDVQRVLLRPSQPLRSTAFSEVPLQPDQLSGGYRGTVELVEAGWWELAVIVQRRAASDLRVPFYVRLEPNSHAPETWQPPAAEGDPEARRLFEMAWSTLRRVRSVGMRQDTADGVGGHVLAEIEAMAPDRMRYRLAGGGEVVTVGAAQQYREPGGTWQRFERATPLRFPDYSWYAHATAHTLGRRETLPQAGGEEARVVSFYVAEDEAWYLWWVGSVSHRVWREVMLAPYHLMVTEYLAYDQPTTIELPLRE